MVFKSLHDEHLTFDRCFQAMAKSQVSAKQMFSVIAAHGSVNPDKGYIDTGDLIGALRSVVHYLDEKDALQLIQRLGAGSELTVTHLEAEIMKERPNSDEILPLDSYLDAPKTVLEEIEYMRSRSRLTAMHQQGGGPSFLGSSSSISRIDLTAPRHNLSSRYSSTFNSPRMEIGGKPDPAFSYATSASKLENKWPELHSKPLSAMVHLNKISTRKSPDIETYPFVPGYVNSAHLDTRGLLGEGYRTSRPVQIESKRFEVLHQGTRADVIPQPPQNSRTEWIETYSNKGRLSKEMSEKSVIDKEEEFLQRRASEKDFDSIKLREIDSHLGELEVEQRFKQRRSHDDIPYRETHIGSDTPDLISRKPSKAQSVFTPHTEPRAPIVIQDNTKLSRITEEQSSKVDYNYYELWKEKHGLAHGNQKLSGSSIASSQQGEEEARTKLSGSGFTEPVLALKRELDQASAQLVMRLPTSLFNLYQVLKRKSDSNFMTKRDLQLIFTRLEVPVSLLVTDVAYELLDFGKDGVVCFSDFERGLLSRDPNILGIARRSQNTHLQDLSQLNDECLGLTKKVFECLAAISERIHEFRRDYWRELRELHSSFAGSSGNTRNKVTFKDSPHTSPEDFEFLRRVLTSNT